MPQMAPLMWLNLMILFLILVTLFFMLIYFMNLPIKSSKNIEAKISTQKIWKW